MTGQIWQYSVWQADASAQDAELVSAGSATEAAEKAQQSYDQEGGDGYDEGPTFWMVGHVGYTWKIEVCAALKVVYRGAKPPFTSCTLKSWPSNGRSAGDGARSGSGGKRCSRDLEASAIRSETDDHESPHLVLDAEEGP